MLSNLKKNQPLFLLKILPSHTLMKSVSTISSIMKNKEAWGSVFPCPYFCAIGFDLEKGHESGQKAEIPLLLGNVD